MADTGYEAGPGLPRRDWRLRILDSAERLIQRHWPPFSLSGIPTRDLSVMRAVIRWHGLSRLMPRDARMREYWTKGGFRGFLEAFNPCCLDDLALALTLFRPGPMASGMADRFLTGGPQEALHPGLKPILEPTRGAIVFQEQVVEILKRFTGFSSAQAFSACRSLYKADMAGLAAFRKLFLRRAGARRIPRRTAERVLEKIEGQGSYALSRAWANEASGCMYKLAYLRIYFPLELRRVMLAARKGRRGPAGESRGWSKERAAAVRERIDIVALIGRYLHLEAFGPKNYRGLCPFHHERTPSFVVNREKMIWHCFGEHRGGDVISFLAAIEGIKPREALARLAKEAGL